MESEYDLPPISIWAFFILAALDIGVNAAAGPAAVATGAHVIGSPLTVRALQLGALAGVTKSGVLVFVEFLSYAGLSTSAWMLLILLASSFGVCVLVTAEISNLVLGSRKCIWSRESMLRQLVAPSGLLIAAVVTAIPLGGECIGLWQAAGELSGESASAQLLFIGLDALEGYVFARMAHNEGHDICPYHVAAAAGAVYGAIWASFTSSLAVWLDASDRLVLMAITVTNFGTRSGYDPNWNSSGGWHFEV